MFKKIFLNDQFIIGIIILNAVIIFTQECNYNNFFVELCDVLCTAIFLIEMVIKHKVLGFKNYWKGLNIMDGILVIISLPSVVNFFAPGLIPDVSVLMVLRIFRMFRFFGLVRFFPYFATIAKNFKIALRQSRSILLIFLILIATFALINCSLFQSYAPQYFATPFDAIYSVFRLFTLEGWYDMPNEISDAIGIPVVVHLIRIYFCGLLIVGGIIGMSLINSIFVDAMVSDNNDDMKEQLERVEAKLDKLLLALEKDQPEASVDLDAPSRASEELKKAIEEVATDTANLLDKKEDDNKPA